MLLLELMLAALLIATLVFGWRLEMKLRALRDSQAGFVKAMQDLDGAAARTQNGLEKLREATEEARGALVPRIEAAQVVAARLEELTGEAEIAAKRAEAAAREVDASAAKIASAIARTRTPAPPPPQIAADKRPSPAPVQADEETAVPAIVRGAAPAAPEPRFELKRTAADFAAMLAAKTTRQPLPGQNQEPQAVLRGEPKPSGSRLREAAALLRGG